MWISLKRLLVLGSRFQAAGPEKAKLRDPCGDSRERGTLRSRDKHDRGHERPDIVNTGMHISVHIFLLTNIQFLQDKLAP